VRSCAKASVPSYGTPALAGSPRLCATHILITPGEERTAVLKCSPKNSLSRRGEGPSHDCFLGGHMPDSSMPVTNHITVLDAAIARLFQAGRPDHIPAQRTYLPPIAGGACHQFTPMSGAHQRASVDSGFGILPVIARHRPNTLNRVDRRLRVSTECQRSSNYPPTPLRRLLRGLLLSPLPLHARGRR